MVWEMSKVRAAAGAGLGGLISIGDGSGRLLWAWLWDGIGRRTVFLIMFIVQATAFFLLANVHQFATFSVLAFVVLLCYGGRLRHNAGVRNRLLRSQADRFHLRADAYGLGLCGHV